jgi:predicted  nucleic acid-binding Zn-ribbon protein
MRLDEIPEAFESFVDRIRGILGREITAAKTVVAALNTEKSLAQAALAEIRGQHELAQKQLAAVLHDLHRGSSLVGLNHEIAEARKKLEALKVETGKASTALEKLAKEQTEREAKVKALDGEAQRLIAIRVEGEAAMAHIRAQLQQVQLGNRP